MRNAVQKSAERVNSSPRTKVVFPPRFSFLHWEPPAWLSHSLCNTLGAAQVFWVPVLFSSPWPNRSSPAFMLLSHLPISQLLFCSPSSYPCWHTPYPICCFLRALLSIAQKKVQFYGQHSRQLGSWILSLIGAAIYLPFFHCITMQPHHKMPSTNKRVPRFASLHMCDKLGELSPIALWTPTPEGIWFCLNSKHLHSLAHPSVSSSCLLGNLITDSWPLPLLLSSISRCSSS